MYPDAGGFLLIIDGSKMAGWECEVQNLSNLIGVPIQVCHLQPGIHKWDNVEWLNKDRCLKDTTIRRYKLGFLEKKYFPERNDWGLEKVLKEDGTSKKLYIPKGLVIPFIRYNRVMRLRIRSLKQNNYWKPRWPL